MIQSLLRRFLVAQPDLPDKNEPADCLYIVPFGTATDPSLVSPQFACVIDTALKLYTDKYAKSIHTGGGHPVAAPDSRECEAFAANTRILWTAKNNDLGDIPLYQERMSWDTGSNAAYLRKTLMEHKWRTVAITVVAEQSARARDDFHEYLSKQYVGWNVTLYVIPVEIPNAAWSKDNIKFCLRYRTLFSLYELLKRGLRKLGFTFYKVKPHQLV